MAELQVAECSRSGEVRERLRRRLVQQRAYIHVLLGLDVMKMMIKPPADRVYPAPTVHVSHAVCYNAYDDLRYRVLQSCLFNDCNSMFAVKFGKLHPQVE